MMDFALITGGLGFIGSFIARQLIEENRVDKVVCLDHFGRYVDSVRPEFADYRKLRLEGISDRVIIERGESKFFSVLAKLIDKYRPLYIFHLAAVPLAKLDNLSTEEALEGNVESTSNIMEVINQLGERDGYKPKSFVYTSSSMVYGDFISDVATEEHPTNPKEIYGTMKLTGEVVAKGLGRYFDIPTTIIRPSAVYGPTDMNRRVSQIFIEKAFMGEKLKVQGADEALDFTYVKDIANGFVLAATSEEGAGEVFNITSGKARTLLEYVMCLKKHFPDLKCEITERDAFRPKRGTLSIDKARKLLKYEPKYSLQEGVDEYVAFIKRYHPFFKKNSSNK
jgi:nucleoside-diphosphate-sugar epimerase